MARSYRSAVRAEQAELTRERILSAFVDELAAGRDDFAVGRVAERAGVSVRTVYQHFPNREAQVEAVAAWIEAQLGPDELPAKLADMPAYSRRRSEAFWAHERIMRAQLAAGVASEVRRRRRRRREAAIEAAVGKSGLRGERLARAAALMKLLISAPFGLPLHDQYGLAREEATRAMEWLVELVVAALERGHAP
jgi:AcrR family transcriptional regulator